MILADSCILIEYDRGKDARLIALADTLQIVVCGATRSEVVAGGRTPAEWQDAVDFLDTFQQVATPETVWDRVGVNIARLRAAGLKVPYPDIVVATLAVVLDIEVWSRDQHFPLIQPHLPGLRLFVEPP